ncbi:MAG: FAD-dependent oxidoreductase [Solirubrobacterales bacterium]|nr:FAD-dependent oxidoreductase [Solirubrobacterales bacterium]
MSRPTAAAGAALPLRVDVAIAGAGAAGLFAALCAARAGASAALVSATPLAQTASYWAQGGPAAALGPDDSFELHLLDTERAGRGAVRRAAAEALVREAPARVRDLQELGVRFDTDRHGRFVLALEGGHSVRRVVHAGGSATGRRVVRALSALVAEEPRIAVLEGDRARASGLLSRDGRCVGVRCADGRDVLARATLLATGGAAALWARTTNPPGSLGAGLLLARLAGATLADLELMQFHPTAVIGVPGREGFLVTEAIRGEGATLHDACGERFVDELAPRDEVSRAIQLRMRQTGSRSVGLDMRAIDPARFPNVVGALREAGLDPARELVPVAPAAHYMVGGVLTDLRGRTTLPGLYALGEASCTGLHGANRLASNSLSECFVFGRRAALSALDEPAHEAGRAAPGRPELTPPLPAVEPSTRGALWRHAGIERSATGLRELLEDPHPLARLIARCALMREESRGVHHRTEFPAPDPALDRHHLVVAPPERGAAIAWEEWAPGAGPGAAGAPGSAGSSDAAGSSDPAESSGPAGSRDSAVSSGPAVPSGS